MGMLVLFAAAMLAQPSPRPSDVDIKVIEAIFIQDDILGGGRDTFATTRIKYEPGRSCYSWILRVEPQDAEVTLTERFSLPAPASHWGDPNSKVSRKRSKAVTAVQESLGDGMLTHGWCVAEGDPTGKHVIEVFHGRRRLHRFVFEIQEPTY